MFSDRLPTIRRGAAIASTQSHLLSVLGLASGSALVVGALSQRYVQRDFDVFFASVANASRGLDPYQGIGALNTNPPQLVGLMLPLARFDAETAYWIWTGLGVGAIALAALIASRVRHLPLTLAAVAVFLAYTGTFLQLAGGQVAWLLAAPMTVAWAVGPTLGAGLLVGLCASVKPFLFLFAPYAAWKRQWRLLAGVALGAAAAASFGAEVLGPRTFLSWARAVSVLNTAFHYSNGSLYGFVARIAQPGALSLIGAGLARGFWLAAAAVVMSFSAIALQGGLERDREWALVLVTAILVSPLGQPYYLTLGLGPLWVTLRRVELPSWRWALVGLFWWPNLLTTPDAPTQLWQLIFYNLTGVSMVALWAILAFGRTQSCAIPTFSPHS